MRSLLAMVMVATVLCTAAAADVLPDTWIRGASSIAVNDDATAIFMNPAGLGMYNENNTYASLSMAGQDVSSFSFASKAGPLGFAYSRHYLWQADTEDDGLLRPGDDAVDVYTLGLGVGSERTWSIGLDYRWLRSQFGDKDKAGTWDLGFMVRPTRYLSVAGAVRNVNEPDFAPGSEWSLDSRDTGIDCGTKMTYVGGIAVRPLGNRLTLMGDLSVEREQDFEDAIYTAGVETEPINGVVLRGSFRSFPVGDDRDEEVSVGLWLNTTSLGAGTSLTTRECAADDVLSYGIATTGERMRTIAKISGKVAEIKVAGPMSDAGAGWSLMGEASSSAQGVIKKIKKAAKDESVDCILLRIREIGPSFVNGPSAIIQEMRDAVLWAREVKGVTVVAFLEYGAATPEYFLASAADEIVLEPGSGVFGLGGYLTVMRYTGTTEKIGVEWDYITAGKYKSTFHSIGAGPLTDEQRVEVQDIIDDGYEELVTAIARGRGFMREETVELCDGSIYTPPEALEAGLIDVIGAYEDAKALAVELAGGDVPDDAEDISTVDVAGWRDKDYDWGHRPTIAIVGAYGDIGVGKGGHDPVWGGQSIGSETLVKELRRARKDPEVKAVILRVDSGGGSGIASEVIWRETVKVAQEKPFIVSMADMAGSGGYFIAIEAERIFADPLTITGSIGVVAMKPVFGPMYEKIDATHETFKRGEHSDAWSLTRHLTEDEYEMARDVIDWYYEDFLEKVAAGRDMPLSELRGIAEGKVYTGNQALEVKLVDELGGLSEAIDYACETAGVGRDDAKIVFYREGRTFFEMLLEEASAKLGLYRLLDFADTSLEDRIQKRAVIEPAVVP